MIPVLFASKAHNICCDMSRCLKMINNESLQLKKGTIFSCCCFWKDQNWVECAERRKRETSWPCSRLTRSAPPSSPPPSPRPCSETCPFLSKRKPSLTSQRQPETGDLLNLCSCKGRPNWMPPRLLAAHQIIFSSGIHSFHPIDIWQCAQISSFFLCIV